MKFLSKRIEVAPGPMFRKFFSLSTFLFTVLIATGSTLAQETPSSPPLPVPAVVTSQEPAPATPQDSDPRLGALLIGEGNLLDVTVYGVAELTQQVRVNERGAIYLPLIGYIPVAGLTGEEAQAAIEKQLVDGGFLKNPHVSVLIKEYTTQGISVAGEVTKPGIYPVHGARRLFDMIAAAGGLTDKAGRRVAMTHRHSPQKVEVVVLSKNPTELPESNVPVYPGDTIVVSRAGVVYVVGEVGRPSGIVMQQNEGMTVLQAIAMAEGTKSTAALDAAKLIRRTGEEPQEFPIPLKQILAGKSPDLPLQADDIVFVPLSKGKSVAKKSLDAIVQIAVGLAVFGPTR